jgi:two-component system, chemotaxis family, sensor kinase CheA
VRHTRGLKDSVMAIRAQPVGSVFQRMPRLVRELSQKTGKKVAARDPRRDHRGRQDDHRAAERPADPHHPQLDRPRHRAAGGRIANGKPETGMIRSRPTSAAAAS